MKIFERSDNKGWGNRLNIIDENNVLVGYDYDQSCCEIFGYYFVRDLKDIKENKKIEDKDIKQEDYIFDTSFCEVLEDFAEYEGGGEVAFKLTNKEKIEDVLYLILYNYHNGYYGHGFDMSINEKILYTGGL